MPYPNEFILTRDRLIPLTEFLTPGHREIQLDGRPHPDPELWIRAWFGHSAGLWDKDTQVIDSVGFNEITADDPAAWLEPIDAHYDVGLVTGEAIHEWVCAESNRWSHFCIQWQGRSWAGPEPALAMRTAPYTAAACNRSLQAGNQRNFVACN